MTSCPECEVLAFVEGVNLVKDMGTQTNDPHDSYVSPEFLCFNCGFHCSYMEVDQCTHCGTWTTSDISVCPDCFENIIGSD